MKQNNLINQKMNDEFSPKTKNRFLLQYDEIPQIAINKITDLICEYNMAGGRVWEDLTISLYDIIKPNVAKHITNVLEKQEMEIDDITANIIVINEIGETVAIYELINPYIQSVNFGNFDWNSNDINIIKMIVGIDDVKIIIPKKKEK